MKTFLSKVDTRSRKAMIDYLAGHFRYDTANSCNNSTSYAHNMKIYNLGLDSAIEDRLYELMQVDEFFWSINDRIGFFDQEHDHKWQAGFNGRQGGYLVLYQGGKKSSGYKSFCPSCCQQNYKTVEESGNICGKCGKPTRRNYEHTHMQVFTYPARSTDQGEDFEDWSMDDLRDRVRLVQEFDQLAEDILHEALYMAKNYEVGEEQVIVKTVARKCLKEIA